MRSASIWMKSGAVMVAVVVLMTLVAPRSYADPNVPPEPASDPALQAVPPAPALKPLPGRGLARASAPEDLGGIVTDPVVEMKVLVLFKTGDADGVFQTIQASLDILGVPYDALDVGLAAPDGTIEESDLWDGSDRGHYQAVFITTSNVWATWLDAGERSLIEAYERTFNVRQVTLYAYPNAIEYGLDLVGVAPLPMDVSLAAGGQTLFSYLRPDASIPLQLYDVYGYLGQPTLGADVTSLIEDLSGNTVLAVFRPGDGREHMVFTLSSYYPAIPPSNIHARLLPYGMINWATRGVFLGERHLYFAPQPDDVLGWGDCWDPVAHAYIFDICYRNEPSDLDNLVAWLHDFRATAPNAADLIIEMPFNAEESFDGDPPEVVNGVPEPGTLTARAVELEDEFTWLNHTYTHADLDFASQATSSAEISQNINAAGVLGFTDFTPSTLLTGDYSGMGRTNPPTAPNPALAQAAYNLGVRYMMINASDPMFTNPSPNTGIPHPDQPGILEVPRYANNIFYAASTPEQETDLYNWIYCSGYAADPVNTPRCYEYNTIINSVTNQSLGFMLDYSVNANMFHMNNLDAYDGDGHTLMTDFIEALYGKYNAYYNNDVPVLSPRTQEIGQRMWSRMDYNTSGVSGELRCGDEISLHTTGAASIPVTGVSFGSNVETYAGQPISTMAMAADETVVIPGASASTPAAVDGLSATRAGEDITLTWNATTVDTGGQPLDALLYRVYGFAGPASEVPLSGFTLLAEVTSASYTHTGAAGGPAIYTYVVTAVGNNCWKRESAESERLVKAVWIVKPGYNLLAMPLVASDASIQAVLADQLTGGDSLDTGDRVLKFDPTTQNYDQIAVYVDGTGTAYDGQWLDAVDFPNGSSPMALNLHNGFWVQHRAADVRQVVVFGRAATLVERVVEIASGPFQVIGSGEIGPLALGVSNLWESGASGGDSLDIGDRLLSFDADSQSYDAIAVLIDGTSTSLDGTWADGLDFPNPSAVELEPGWGYWFHNRAPAAPFVWSYPRP